MMEYLLINLQFQKDIDVMPDKIGDAQESTGRKMHSLFVLYGHKISYC